MTPAQLQDLLEVRFDKYVSASVRQIVKGMVASLTEGLTEQVSALTIAHGKSERKLGRLASNLSAMNQRMEAQKAEARERDEKMEQQLEQLRKAVEEVRIGATERGASGGVVPPVAGSGKGRDRQANRLCSWIARSHV